MTKYINYFNIFLHKITLFYISNKYKINIDSVIFYYKKLKTKYAIFSYRREYFIKVFYKNEFSIFQG